MSEIWLEAHADPVANLHTFPSCVTLANVYGQTNHQCVVADNGDLSGAPKLKVYDGTSLSYDGNIVETPTAIVSFHVDTTEPRIPAIALAAGPYIYVYKNIRPYFKFTVPSLDVNQLEQDLWNQAKDDKIDIQMLHDMLESIKSDADAVPLTPLSTKFLQTPPHQRTHFVAVYRDNPLRRQTVITCLETLKKSHPEDDAISCLVIGTENKDLYILDPEAFTVLVKLPLPSAPVFLRSTGLYDVDYRILVACRNGNILVMKKGLNTPKFCITLNSHPVGIERIGKSIVVATMDKNLMCYSNKMKSLWTIPMVHNITCLACMDFKAKTFKGVLVGLESGEVRLYREKFLVDTLTLPDPPAIIQFGKYDREDSTLLILTKSGGLYIYILKRNVDLNQGLSVTTIGPSPKQFEKLNVPRKTKTFVEQTLREREHGVAMHRQFQHDLYKLRLTTASNFAEALQKKMIPVSTNNLAPLKLAANVQGLGPMFRLSIEVMNTSANSPIIGAYVVLVTNDSIYVLEKSYISLPLLVPSLAYTFNTMIRCTNEQGVTDSINVFVYIKGKCAPVLTAMIDMPASESIIL